MKRDRRVRHRDQTIGVAAVERVDEGLCELLRPLDVSLYPRDRA
jgi:hypothetical protein